MDAMAKEGEAAEKAKEEKEADSSIEPNPQVAKTKATIEGAKEEMETKVKEEVEKSEAKLASDVKKQESKAAIAKAKSKLPGHGPSASGHSEDEVWTANMPEDVLKSFVQKKVQAAIKK